MAERKSVSGSVACRPQMGSQGQTARDQSVSEGDAPRTILRPVLQHLLCRSSRLRNGVDNAAGGECGIARLASGCGREVS